MIWSMIYLLSSVALTVWHLLNKYVKSASSTLSRRNIHPSDALIEQCLPAEIFEHVLSLTDPPSFLTCRFVSKYWYTATTNSILEVKVINEYQSMSRQSIESLLKAELKINMKSGDFLSYSDSYPKGLILRDIAAACLEGKTLLALEEDSIERLAFEVFSKGYNQGFIRKLKDTYWIKTMANHTYLARPNYPNKLEVHWSGRYFKLNDGGKIMQKADELTRYSGPADIILSPKALEGLFGRTMEIIMYRPRLQSNFLLGFIPGSNMADVAYFALLTLIPCLIHDLGTQMSDPSQSTIFVLISATALVISMLFLYVGGSRGQFGLLVEMAHWFCVITLPIFASKIYAEFLAFLGSAAVAGMYIALLFSYMQIWPMTSKRIPSVIFFTSLLMLANDWSRTMAAINDGTIYKSFMKWFMSYLMLLSNILAMYFVTRSWQYKSEVKIIAALLFIFVIVMTLYFPIKEIQ